MTSSHLNYFKLISKKDKWLYGVNTKTGSSTIVRGIYNHYYGKGSTIAHKDLIDLKNNDDVVYLHNSELNFYDLDLNNYYSFS